MNDTRKGPRLLTVTSGKGGVGKTNVAVNLALCLRLFGQEVLLVDADVGLASVDVLLGLRLKDNLRDVVLGGKPIEQVVVDGPLGLKILPGSSGVEAMAALADEDLKRLLGQLRDYCREMDFVVVDTAPGIAPAVTNCLLAADEVLLVTNPEPMALTDAYALLKVMSARAQARAKRILVLMNQINTREEALRNFDRLKATVERFLDLDVQYLGSVAWDETVSRASKKQVDFLTHYEHSACSRDLRKIAARLVSAGRGESGSMNRFFRSLAEVTSDG